MRVVLTSSKIKMKMLDGDLQACRLTLLQACRSTLLQACRLTLLQACRLTLLQACKKHQIFFQNLNPGITEKFIPAFDTSLLLKLDYSSTSLWKAVLQVCKFVLLQLGEKASLKIVFNLSHLCLYRLSSAFKISFLKLRLNRMPIVHL